MKIPRDLQKVLPFKDTPKILQAKREGVKRVAIIQEPSEAKVSQQRKSSDGSSLCHLQSLAAHMIFMALHG